MESAVLPSLFPPGLFPPKTHGFSWFYHHVSAILPAVCTRMYTAQVNIWHRYRDKHLTCFPEATWRWHHHLGRMAATRFTSHVPVQQSDLLMHQLFRYHLLAYEEDRSFRVAIWSTFVTRVGNFPYILYGTPSDFYPSPHTWRNHASRPLQSFIL